MGMGLEGQRRWGRLEIEDEGREVEAGAREVEDGGREVGDGGREVVRRDASRRRGMVEAIDQTTAGCITIHPEADRTRLRPVRQSAE